MKYTYDLINERFIMLETIKILNGLEVRITFTFEKGFEGDFENPSERGIIVIDEAFINEYEVLEYLNPSIIHTWESELLEKMESL